MSVINNSIGIEYEVRLLIDEPEVRKCIERAIRRAVAEFKGGWYAAHIRHFVPWLNPTNYGSSANYLRSIGEPDEQLRDSFDVIPGLKDMKLYAEWEAGRPDYAPYVSKDSGMSNPRIRRARSPGTTLHWVSKSKPMFKLRFWQICAEELSAAGLLKGRRQPHHYIDMDPGTIYASV